ncbi:MAG TPA: GPW/gp25 family protein [Thermoanaerobaculia bacterium]|nr:GPW/gp25 family protein [Thermoanaerobaculia bacterium]
MRTIDVLGRGLAFPVRPDERSRALPVAAGAEKVRQAILLILDTEPGERIMRPTFGCGLHRYIAKPNTTATRALIQREVTLALAAWEPRIRVRSIAVEPGADPALVLIEIDYVHARDGSRGNLVYPFYLET